MIDVRLLRSDPEFVKAAMVRRAKPALIHDLEQAQQLDSRLRDITNERDANRAQINGISKDVATMRRNKDESGADALMTQSRALGGTKWFVSYAVAAGWHIYFKRRVAKDAWQCRASLAKFVA